MRKKCADCGCEVNRNVIQGMYYCPRCDDDKREIDVLPMILFDHITASLEVLAEKLVVEYRHGVKDYAYYSTVTGGLYNTKVEAIAATVAKLKEPVSNDYAGSTVGG